MRVALLECVPGLNRWPSSAKQWRDELPMLSENRRYWSSRPEPRVNWAKTRRAGWPPKTFAIRKRHRTTDELPPNILLWTLTELESAVSKARALLGRDTSLSEILNADAGPRLQAALPLLSELADQEPATPSRDDLHAVRGIGWPWSAVADVASVLLKLRSRQGVELLAERLIGPDGYPDRMFQLGVLGTVLATAERCGLAVRGKRPIGQMTTGPVYEIVGANGELWDVWCEAAQCWEYYGVPDVYRAISTGLTQADARPFIPRPLRPDILLASSTARAVVIECKFPFTTADPGYVASGLSQSHFYATELQPVFPDVEALVVGPSELVSHQSSSSLRGIRVGVGSASAVEDAVIRLMT
jgi:hypothetical protein